MWSKTHLHFTNVGARTQILIGLYPASRLLVQQSIYFFCYELGRVGTPDFIDLVACDMGSSEVAWPPSSWEGRNLWPLSLSLSHQVSKRKQLSARPGAWTWFIDSNVYRCLIAMCPRAAVNWYLLISRPLAGVGREGWENDISVSHSPTWF